MNKFIDSLSIVIVLYNIRLEDSYSFKSILDAATEQNKLSVLLYDNSQKAQHIGEYPGIAICYKHDPMNPGISKAYNYGANQAKATGKEWILVLDQDTTLPITILQSYEKAIKDFSTIKLFAPLLKLDNGIIFSPCKYRFKRGFHIDAIENGIHDLYEIAPVNSGMLINIEAFFNSGGYNNAVKLDFSDFQFVQRFRKIHPKFCLIDAVCQQDFSNDEVSIKSHLRRFKYYCEGALHITKDGLWDWAQYYLVILIRALKLTIRYKKSEFLIIYINCFLVKSFSTKD